VSDDTHLSRLIAALARFEAYLAGRSEPFHDLHRADDTRRLQSLFQRTEWLLVVHGDEMTTEWRHVTTRVNERARRDLVGYGLGSWCELQVRVIPTLAQIRGLA